MLCTAPSPRLCQDDIRRDRTQYQPLCFWKPQFRITLVRPGEGLQGDQGRWQRIGSSRRHCSSLIGRRDMHDPRRPVYAHGGAVACSRPQWMESKTQRPFLLPLVSWHAAVCNLFPWIVESTSQRLAYCALRRTVPLPCPPPSPLSPMQLAGAPISGPR
jgi:hypothetical protein